jgi:hypothetical protein
LMPADNHHHVQAFRLRRWQAHPKTSEGQQRSSITWARFDRKASPQHDVQPDLNANFDGLDRVAPKEWRLPVSTRNLRQRVASFQGLSKRRKTIRQALVARLQMQSCGPDQLRSA